MECIVGFVKCWLASTSNENLDGSYLHPTCGPNGRALQHGFYANCSFCCCWWVWVTYCSVGYRKKEIDRVAVAVHHTITSTSTTQRILRRCKKTRSEKLEHWSRSFTAIAVNLDRGSLLGNCTSLMNRGFKRSSSAISSLQNHLCIGSNPFSSKRQLSWQLEWSLGS